MGAKKGQLFVVSVVFMVGMIFAVQQVLFNYSRVQMSSPFEIRDAEVFDNILDIVKKTITETHYCNETKDGFQGRLENLKASFLEEFGREYSIEILYTLDCSKWENSPPDPAPLSLSLSVNRQGMDTRGNFQLYHSSFVIVGDSQTLANGNPSVPTWTHPLWTAKIPGATWIWSEYKVSYPEQNTTVNFTRTFNLPAAGSFQGSLIIAVDNLYTCYLNGLFIAADRGFTYEDRYSVDDKLQNGVNTFKCEVMNIGGANSTAENNPAGLLYKIFIYASHTTSACGNGVKEGAEACDLGDATHGNGNGVCPKTCSFSCTLNSCGDTTPPTVSITSPSSGVVVSGTIIVAATATDNVAVAGVQFKLDGANLDTEDTASPYSISWDTTTASNGAHTLTAVARDTSGNTATSSPVGVTVSNPIDMLSYFLSDYPDKMLTGTHKMNFKQDGQKAFYTKWDSQSYEIYEWDNQYIYLREDHSGSPNPNYAFNPGIWMKRYMSVGEQIDVSTNTMQYYDSACNPTTSQAFPYRMKLEQHIPSYNLGGDLGTEDVIVMIYNYSIVGSNKYEKSYYSKDWGWVKWEEYDNDILVQSSTFNMISAQPPIQPDTTSSCTMRLVCDEITQYNGTANDASSVLQQCINNAAPDQLVEIPPGRYYVSHQIRIDQKPITIRTQGKNEGMPKCALDNDCAELIASDTFQDSGGILLVTQGGTVVDHIVLNGNRVVRSSTQAGQLCRSGSNSYGFNMRLMCSNCKFINSVSKYALCGTGLEVAGAGKNVTVSYNTIAFNGVQQNSLWSDGITVHDYSNSFFIGNEFIDNTDIDFIFGGCQNCTVQNNRISHTGPALSRSFTGLMIHAWPGGATSGNYTNSDFSNNLIDCGADRRCGYGLLIGSDPWYIADVYGGSVHDNVIRNARDVGLLIDDAHDVEVYKNTAENSTILYGMGTRSYNINVSKDDPPVTYTRWNWDYRIPW